MNEREAAIAVSTGQLPSPFDLGGSILIALRVTGSGYAFRPGVEGGRDEHVWRSPDVVLAPGFVERCAGLSVILEHPPGNPQLTSDEFGDRVVGAVTYPYRAGRDGFASDGGPEVWGVSRVFDRPMIQMLREQQLSTSPCVIFEDPAGDNTTIPIGDGSHLLIEGDPHRLDHLAICGAGVWDKGGEPSGVRIDVSTEPKKGVAAVAEEETKPDPMDALMEMLKSMDAKQDSLGARMDAWEKDKEAEADARKRADADTMVGAQRDTESAMADRRKKADAAEDEPERGGVGGPRADSEAQRWQGYAAVRADLDPVVNAFGDSLDNPFHLETPLAYRRRSLQRYIQYSARPEVRGLDLRKADANALALIQPVIIADALAHAMSPAMIPDGELREVKTRDAAGRIISTFYGKPSAWTNEFKAPERNLVRVNRNPDRT